MEKIVTALKRLIDQISDDEKFHGGLLTTTTIRECDEARVLLNRYAKENHDKS